MRRNEVIRRKDAERFIDEVHGDDPELAESLRIEERELEAGGRLAEPVPQAPHPLLSLRANRGRRPRSLRYPTHGPGIASG